MHQPINELRVTGIFVYPVKSLGGISLQEAEVLPKGLAYDRRWMLVDAQGKFLTQRLHPLMALFQTVLSSQGLSISKGHDQIFVPYATPGESIQAEVWGDKVMVTEVSKLHSQWFSDLLGVFCRLVFFPEVNPRAVDPDYGREGDHTSLSDGYPILIAGQASLDDLNGRMADAVPMDRFRPNIVFTGGVPYEEDQWSNFSINDTLLEGVKPCGRCVFTTINQRTAEMGKEPLATLSTYRQRNQKVLFGQNVIVRKQGIIRVGDTIKVQSHRM